MASGTATDIARESHVPRDMLVSRQGLLLLLLHGTGEMGGHQSPFQRSTRQRVASWVAAGETVCQPNCYWPRVVDGLPTAV